MEMPHCIDTWYFYHNVAHVTCKITDFYDHLDGGGVRGYSQLLILKALMDKVERIERSEPNDGQTVDSSFHPIPWSTVPPTLAAKRRLKSKNSTLSVSHGTDSNGKDKGKGRAIMTSTPPSAVQHSQFYPHHYFDWIAGTSTGG